MPNQKSTPFLVDIVMMEEVAAYLKVTTCPIYQILEQSQIPAFKICEAWRFCKDAFEIMTRGETPQKDNK